METCFVYMTAGSEEEARKIAGAIVSERLVACVNILPGVHSLYWWEGKVQEDQEVVLVAKTQKRHLGALTARVKALHSYTCPCIVALPMEGGNSDFLAWIVAETSPRP